MRGNVIGFDPDTNTGAISGHDGNRYDFATADWRGESRPRHGDVVDFQPQGQRATEIYLIEPVYVAQSWGQAFFSFHGRISRSDYWVKTIILGSVTLVINLLILLLVFSAGAGSSTALVGAFGMVNFVVGLLVIWPQSAILIKRIHDREKTGWLCLAFYLPFISYFISITLFPIAITILLGLVSVCIGIWFFVEFGCLRGTVGANRYGPDPVFGLLMRVYGHMVVRTDSSRF